jgi:hypothetical protein
MMHQTIAPPSLAEAARELTEPRVLRELAHYGYDCRTRDELAAALERVAAHATRASDGYAALARYDLAAERRERARELRRWAAALRVVHAAE